MRPLAVEAAHVMTQPSEGVEYSGSGCSARSAKPPSPKLTPSSTICDCVGDSPLAGHRPRIEREKAHNSHQESSHHPDPLLHFWLH
jgi:hypothetical protein